MSPDSHLHREITRLAGKIAEHPAPDVTVLDNDRGQLESAFALIPLGPYEDEGTRNAIDDLIRDGAIGDADVRAAAEFFLSCQELLPVGPMTNSLLTWAERRMNIKLPSARTKSASLSLSGTQNGRPLKVVPLPRVAGSSPGTDESPGSSGVARNRAA